MIPAIDSQGKRMRISLKQAAKYKKRGRGSFDASGTFIFAHDDHRNASVESSMSGAPAPSAGQHSARVDTRCEVERFSGSDSGFSLLPYPMPWGVTGMKFPALSKAGAGL